MSMKFENVYRELYTDKQVSKITYETENVHLDDILEDFQDFLKGCGFHIKGTLQIVEEEES